MAGKEGVDYPPEGGETVKEFLKRLLDETSDLTKDQQEHLTINEAIILVSLNQILVAYIGTLNDR
jgi:hypothetical protein